VLICILGGRHSSPVPMAAPGWMLNRSLCFHNKLVFRGWVISPVPHLTSRICWFSVGVFLPQGVTGRLVIAPVSRFRPSSLCGTRVRHEEACSWVAGVQRRVMVSESMCLVNAYSTKCREMPPCRSRGAWPSLDIRPSPHVLSCQIWTL